MFFSCVILVKPKVDGKPTDVTCLLNETAKLNIKFSAIPKANVQWFRADGSEIISDDLHQIITDDNGQSTLIIHHTTKQDTQAYTARATNKVGSVDAKINLNVKGKINHKKLKQKICSAFICFLSFFRFSRSQTNIEK